MRDFSFHTAGDLDEALELLSRYGDDARPIAGGTAMVVLLKQSLVSADHLVSLNAVPGMGDIAVEDGELHIGALVTHREVETSELVRQHVPLLAEVYGRVASVRIRNAATVGGGLAHADPSQDPPPALMALDARVGLASRSSRREVPVEHLFLDYYETAIEPDEVLTELIVPTPASGARGTYRVFLPRTADDYPTVGVAAVARVEDGTCVEARVALGAVAPTPVRATAVEDALLGREVTADAIRQAAELVNSHLDPLEDFRGSAQYKRDMATVFTRRALEQALGLA